MGVLVVQSEVSIDRIRQRASRQLANFCGHRALVIGDKLLPRARMP